MHTTATATQKTLTSTFAADHAAPATATSSSRKKSLRPAMKYSTPSSPFSPAPASAEHPSQLEESRTGFAESGEKSFLSSGRSCRTDTLRTLIARKGRSHVDSVCRMLRYRMHAD